MKTFHPKALVLVLTAMTLVPAAHALEIEARGVSTVSKTLFSNPGALRAEATLQAKRNAVLAALDKVVGAGTRNNPKVQAQLDELVTQVGEDVFYDPAPDMVGDQYRLSITLRMDDKELRTLISDLGLALNTNAVRSQSILVLMDEFFTTPTDLRAPLEELVEFRHEAGNSYKEREAAASSSKSAYAASDKQAYAVKAAEASRMNGSRDTRVAGAASDGMGGQAAVAGRDTTRLSAASASSYQAAGARSRNVAAASSSNAAYAHSINAEEHDNTYFKKLVKYQPQNTGPDKKSYTYNELKGQMVDLDIKVIDNALFKSRYYGNRAITLDQLENSSELSKYVAFARKEATADYFMLGTSVIYDTGIDPSSGMRACTGVASTKNFSTKTGEDIGSATQSDAASGTTPDDCRAKLATKLAGNLANQVGKHIQDYYKRRTMYGSEFVVRLTGGALPLMTRMAFTQAMKSVPGLENQVQRQASGEQIEIVASYKGADPLDQAVAMALASNPQFTRLDSMVDGNVIILCMNGCSKPKASKP